VKAPAAAPANDPITSGQIKTIHALGGTVVLTNKKDGQEATGEDAIYDVKRQKVTMTGKKVILTQKQNVVEGKRLEINLATSQYILIPYDHPAKGGNPAQKPRVRAILQQDNGKTRISINPFGEAPKKDGSATQPASPPQQSTPSQQSAPSSGWQPQGR